MFCERYPPREPWYCGEGGPRRSEPCCGERRGSKPSSDLLADTDRIVRRLYPPSQIPRHRSDNTFSAAWAVHQEANHAPEVATISTPPPSVSGPSAPARSPRARGDAPRRKDLGLWECARASDARAPPAGQMARRPTRSAVRCRGIEFVRYPCRGGTRGVLRPFLGQTGI